MAPSGLSKANDQAAPAVCLALAFVCTAQVNPANSTLAFSAVSIEPFAVGPGAKLSPFQADPGGLRWHGVTLHGLILRAYGIDEGQLLVAEDWTQSEYFSIDAATSTAATTDQELVMLRQFSINALTCGSRSK